MGSRDLQLREPARADFGDQSDELRTLFDGFETFDFEQVMHHLISAAAVVDTYGGNEELVNRLEQDMEVLRQALLSAIANSHPDVPRRGQ
jgi:hypothetical protein